MKKIFISYSHKDENLKKAFESHLSGLKRQNLIEVWSDREILIGDKWDSEIKEHLDHSDIILFLISSDFLESEYINEIEINHTIEKHKKDLVKIVPIFLRPCDFTSSILAEFQGVPRDGEFITNSKNMDNSFLAVIKELKKIIENFSNKCNISSINNSTDIKTLHQALDLYVEQKDKLSNKTTKSEFEELEKIKNELFDNLFGDFNEKITSLPKIKNQVVISLFERIISSEKLTPLLITEISNFRKDHETFTPYDRSVIVSSITLSVLTWNIFDVKKVDLLIDFLTDFEPEVWQKSLTGLIMSILIHHNRLQRFPCIIHRLQSLQEIEHVQIGIYILDTILRKQLYEYVISPKNLGKDDYLNETPYNWFYPFYIENEIITEAINTTQLDSEIDDFIEYIKQIPLISAYKYSLCNALKSSKIVKVKIEDNEAIQKRIKSLNTAIWFEPYYNFVSEIYLYYKYYPIERVQRLFESKATIAQTKLKDIIVNKVQALKLSADLHYEKKEYGDCILKLKELLNISPNQHSALLQISDCFIQKDEYSNALNYLFQIEKINPNDEENILNIGICLNRTKQYSKSNEYLLNLIEKHPSDEHILVILADNYEELKLYETSIDYCLKALSLNSENVNILDNIISCYIAIKKPDLALEYGVKLNKLTPNNIKTLINLSNIYVELDEIETALKLSEEAFLIDSSNIDTVFDYGRKLFVNGEYGKAKIILNKIFTLRNNESYLNITYGNLGHIYLFENNLEESEIFYKKCVLAFSDIKDFENKFDSDLIYATKAGITTERYNKIKNDLIEYWQNNH